MMLEQKLDEHLDAIALKVSREISEDDKMSMPGAEGWYFNVGRDALKHILLSLMLARPRPRVERILDFACGHGRVARFIHAAFPDTSLVGSDTDVSGVSFVSEHLGFEKHISKAIPSENSFIMPFDLIWCGSLLTHLDQENSLGLIKMFADNLTPGGVAVFTSHGRYVASKVNEEKFPYILSRDEFSRICDDFDRTGFGFAEYTHLETPDGSGISLTSTAWLYEKIASLKNVKIIHFSERAWGNHQDVVAIQKVEVGANA